MKTADETATPDEVTQLLEAYSRGDQRAFEQLMPLIYQDLHRIARRQRRRSGSSATLDTTSLVHESYLKLVKPADIGATDKGHFLAIAARAMRQVIINHARKRNAEKRGGGQISVTFDEQRVAVHEKAEQLLALDQVLEELSLQNERLARVVECRFFAGLGEEETAVALNISLRTAQRDWTRARAWLRSALT